MRQFCALEGHQFWPEDVSLRDLLLPSAIITHHHITDVYLLGLAVSRNGKLATFDRRIPGIVVDGGEAALELISP